MEKSLLSYVTSKFVKQTENVATESLYYILSASPVAKAAFMSYIGHAVTTLPGDLVLATQSGGADGSIHDLIGKDTSGSTRLIVECKFWAGLTDLQPVGYMNSVTGDGAALLLFIAPSQRFTTLWAEIQRRAAAAGLKVDEKPAGNDWRVACWSENRYSALTSWRSLLDYIHDALSTHAEAAVANDVRQLQGLADTMDAEAFLPLSAEELTGFHGRRMAQYAEMVEECYRRLKHGGYSWVGTKNLRSAWGPGKYGHYLNMYEYGVRLYFCAPYWQTLAETPIWLELGRKDFTGGAPELAERLAPLAEEIPQRVFPRGVGFFAIPLYVAYGEEWGAVIEQLMAQIFDVAKLLEASAVADVSGSRAIKMNGSST